MVNGQWSMVNGLHSDLVLPVDEPFALVGNVEGRVAAAQLLREVGFRRRIAPRLSERVAVSGTDEVAEAVALEAVLKSLLHIDEGVNDELLDWLHLRNTILGVPDITLMHILVFPLCTPSGERIGESGHAEVELAGGLAILLNGVRIAQLERSLRGIWILRITVEFCTIILVFTDGAVFRSIGISGIVVGVERGVAAATTVQTDVIDAVGISGVFYDVVVVVIVDAGTEDVYGEGELLYPGGVGCVVAL